MDGMSFDDLPDDWPDRPLTEPRLVADVLDLFVSAADRERGALVVLACDEQARLVQPFVVSDLDDEVSDQDMERAFNLFVSPMSGVGSLLVAIARKDGLSITAADRAWCRAAQRACGDGVRLLGVHVVTLYGSRAVPAAHAAA